MKLKTKKGQGVLGGLTSLAMGLVTAGAFIAVGSLVLAELKADPTVQAGYDGENETNNTQPITNAQEGINNVTSRFGIIATIAVMGVLLALVFRFAQFGK